MNALIITIRLESPLLVTSLGNGDENSSRSLAYIPGAMLRGLLVSRYKTNAGDLLDDEKAKKLFFSSQVRFLNAYLQDANGARSLPTPTSWRTSKGADPDNMQASDFAIKFDETKETGIRKPFWGQTSDQSGNLLAPKEALSIHIGNQNRGVVQRGESTVFQYQALASGQRFVAVIVSEDAAALQSVEELLQDKTLHLGRSRSAKYGRAVIEKIETDAKWRETEPKNPPMTTITLLSDALLRDEHGQPTHNLDTYLSAWLGKNVKCNNAFVRSAEVGGFNRKWGLPLAQFPALGMGSVFVYKAEELSAGELADLVKTGIGERRVDGFGRIAVNWLDKPTIQLTKASQANPESGSVQLSSSSQELAQRMAERLLTHDLENKLVAKTLRFSIKGNLNNHQLSRLRLVLRHAIDRKATDLSDVNNFFKDLKKDAQEQWRKTRLIEPGQSTRFRLWLDERINKQDGLEQLGMNSAEQFPAVAGRRADLSGGLKVKYTLRLMETVVDQAMKQNRKEG